MLSQRLNRSTAIFRNAMGYRPIVRFFATRSFLSLQSVPIASVSFEGFSPVVTTLRDNIFE